MEVVEFVAEIEQKLDIQFSDSDLQDSRFVTISGISELILARSAQTSEADNLKHRAQAQFADGRECRGGTQRNCMF